MKKEIKIPVTIEKFFRQYLEVIKIFRPFSSLRPKELDVLAELLKYNFILKDVPEKHRWKIVFDYDTRVEMKTNLGMKDETFQNILSSLRSKGFIVNNTVPKKYLIEPSKENYLVFKYEISS